MQNSFVKVSWFFIELNCYLTKQQWVCKGKQNYKNEI